MRQLNGSELAGYIKERQAKQVRALRQSWKVVPKLAIIQTTDDPVIDIYVGLKQRYGQDILVDVEVYKVPQAEAIELIKKLNSDETVHGIIVQLPLEDPDQTDEIVGTIAPAKDVDGLGDRAEYISATATAIDWLLSGYGIELAGKEIAIVGAGRLVGAPLAKLWTDGGYNVSVFDDKSENMAAELSSFDVIVCAAGVPGLVTSSMIKDDAIVVDAGTTASENGAVVGDLAKDTRERNDLTITPEKGGVGPLTIAVLIDNVITSARKIADAKGQQDL